MPALNNRLINISKKEEMLQKRKMKQWNREDMERRKQSQRELRKLMSTRGYWTKEVNKRHQDLHSSIITKSEGKYLSEYIFPNDVEAKNVENFLNSIKLGVIEKMKINKKVKFTLKITLVKFTEDGKEETSDYYLSKPFYVLLIKKDITKCYNSLYTFFNEKIVELKTKGTGWRLKSIDYLVMKLVKYNPIRGGCNRIDLPAILSNRKIFPIIKSDDNECLKWSICYYLCNGEKGEISKEIREKAESLNWNKIGLE